VKLVLIGMLLFLSNISHASDLDYLGCDPHVSCMRTRKAIGITVKYEDVNCLQVRLACSTIQCPKLDSDANSHIRNIQNSQAAIQGELANIASYLVNNESSINSSSSAKAGQDNVCLNLETFKNQTMVDVTKKNEFVQALTQVAALDSSNQQIYLNQIDALPINPELKGHIKSLVSVSKKSSNDLKLIIDQYSHSNSTGIDELLNSSVVSCEAVKSELNHSVDLLNEQNKNLNDRKRALENQFNEYNRQIGEQEARKC
jgi:hypothetical protein